MLVELTLSGEQFQAVGFVDSFTSLIWTRRYYEIGEFELHSRLSDFSLFQSSKYVWSKEFSEVGIIEECGYRRSDGTAYCKGRFLEAALTERVIDFYSSSFQNGTPEYLARNMVQKIAIQPDDPSRVISGLHLGNESGISGESVYIEPRGKVLWDACSNVLKPAELAMRVRFDYPNQYFEVWQGVDRTVEQADNSLAIFSDEYENIESPTYSRNVREYRNFAFVAGEGEGDARVVVPVNLVNSSDRIREVWVDARDLQKKDQTDEQYHQALIQRGKEKLAEYRVSETVGATVHDNNSLVYKKDYDLGDVCSYIDDLAGVVVNQRITEIIETFEDGGHTITPVFGEEDKTILQKVRRNAN